MTINQQQKTAWVLVNVGTPEHPSTIEVKKYLKEFLDDPKVIDLSFLLRKFLVHAIIAPFRAPRSAKKYRQIWTPEGSPLLIHMNELVQKVQAVAPENTDVIGLMRYGQPALKEFLQHLPGKKYGEVVVLPLYPQHADSTTGSVEQLVSAYLSKPGNTKSNTGSSDSSGSGSRSNAGSSNLSSNSDGSSNGNGSGDGSGNGSSTGIRVIDQFYNHPGFIDSFVERMQAHDLPAFDHILFSYHGLPLRQILKGHPDKPVADCSCQQSMPDHGHHCYRATCYATTRLLSARAGIEPGRCSTSFQSRLSRNWMTPFTDETLVRLATEGKKKVLVVPASFVADCLETTLEIGMEYREMFIEKGGEKLVMTESLNSSTKWVETVVELFTGRPAEPGIS
jgi:ferrochelatase